MLTLEAKSSLKAQAVQLLDEDHGKAGSARARKGAKRERCAQCSSWGLMISDTCDSMDALADAQFYLSIISGVPVIIWMEESPGPATGACVRTAHNRVTRG